MTNVGAEDRVAVYREVLGRLLMSRRKRAGLTLSALAKAAGISRAAAGRLEFGAAAPNVEQLRRLATALEEKPSTLMAELEQAIDYMESRRTLIVEAMPEDATKRSRLLRPPELLFTSPIAMIRVTGATLMKEIEAALGLRPDPPRTPTEAFLSNCRLAGVPLPTSRTDLERAKCALALAILDDDVDSDAMTFFLDPDQEAELLDFIEIDELLDAQDPTDPG